MTREGKENVQDRKIKGIKKKNTKKRDSLGLQIHVGKSMVIVDVKIEFETQSAKPNVTRTLTLSPHLTQHFVSISAFKLMRHEMRTNRLRWWPMKDLDLLSWFTV